MRATDAAPPTIPAHPIPPGQPSASWTGTPIVGLEYLPAGDVWDDIDTQTVVWDNPTLTWDDPTTASGFTDVWCDTTGLDIVHGEPDDAEQIPPSHALLTLYDPTGRYRRRTPDGRLVYYAAGRRLAVLGEMTGGYLSPLTGLATTPDAADLTLTAAFRLIANVRSEHAPASVDGWLAGQWGSSGNEAWNWATRTTGMTFTVYTDTGVRRDWNVMTPAQLAIALPINQDRWIRVDLNPATGRADGYYSSDGVTWTAAGAGVYPAFASVRDSSAPLVVGSYSTSAARWNGRIYSATIERFTGSVMWRFDADDYPGSGTSYTDPRGRTWTLTNAAAITPRPRYWLFHGKVATWHELPDGFVEIAAYSTTAALAQPPGKDWVAGVDAQTLAARAAAIVAGSGIGGVTLKADAGTNTLAVPEPAPDSALEMLQRAAWSDGGIVYADADDAVIVRNRLWRDGRSDQPATRTILTDNVCGIGAVVVWDPEYAHDDQWLAASVVLSTDAGLVATYANPAELIDPALRFTHPDTDLWRTQPEGDGLAAWIATLRGDQRLALSMARIHLHDSRLDAATWRAALDLRIADQVRWQHVDEWPDGAAVLVDVTMIAATIRHLITPDSWTVELETSPAIAYTPVGMWDLTVWRWDDADPNADWR